MTDMLWTDVWLPYPLFLYSTFSILSNDSVVKDGNSELGLPMIIKQGFQLPNQSCWWKNYYLKSLIFRSFASMPNQPTTNLQCIHFHLANSQRQMIDFQVLKLVKWIGIKFWQENIMSNVKYKNFWKLLVQFKLHIIYSCSANFIIFHCKYKIVIITPWL